MMISKVGAKERVTQNRIVKLFKIHLACDYLGYWKDHDKRNIVPSLLKPFLQNQDYSDNLIGLDLRELDQVMHWVVVLAPLMLRRIFIECYYTMALRLRKVLESRARLIETGESNA
ncbi:MAG: hypothetical protein OXD44_00630 [Gammaproteobacteria bacterium]|nr:hypothetical protein [Gammaproteobacteria bacterium]